jgi:hypothetical protein
MEVMVAVQSGSLLDFFDRIFLESSVLTVLYAVRCTTPNSERAFHHERRFIRFGVELLDLNSTPEARIKHVPCF